MCRGTMCASKLVMGATGGAVKCRNISVGRVASCCLIASGSSKVAGRASKFLLGVRCPATGGECL